jgi:hypothetical protein
MICGGTSISTTMGGSSITLTTSSSGGAGELRLHRSLCQTPLHHPLSPRSPSHRSHWHHEPPPEASMPSETTTLTSFNFQGQVLFSNRPWLILVGDI